MRGAAFLVGLLWAASGAAQTAVPTTYKCMDERRQVTYSNIPCEKQGLKDGGPVADRTTSMPFTEPPKKAAPAKPAAQAEPPTTKLQPVNPLIEKAVK
jgi:hypothetical protein